MSNCSIQFTFALLVTLSMGCAEQSVTNSRIGTSRDDSSNEIARIARDFKTLKLLTPEPVFVNPELAMLCVGASKEMVESARVDHGPHANCTVNIYMNSMAVTAFEGSKRYPVGSIVVKEKQMLGYRTKNDDDWNGTGNGVGGMIKRKNRFDSAGGDWEYFYFEDVNNIEFGKIASCARCHVRAKDTDYVYGFWKTGNKWDGHASDDSGY